MDGARGRYRRKGLLDHETEGDRRLATTARRGLMDPAWVRALGAFFVPATPGQEAVADADGYPVWATPVTLGVALNDLTDVNDTGRANGNLLYYSFGTWVPGTPNAAFGLGNSTSNIPVGDVAVPATTTTTLATVTLAAGTYLLTGWANILMGAGAGVADLFLRVVTTDLGAPATLTLAAAAQGAVPTPTVVVSPLVSTSYNLACYASAACTAKATGGARAATGATGIRAIKLFA